MVSFVRALGVVIAVALLSLAAVSRAEAQNADNFFVKGEELLLKGEFDLAIELFQRGLTLDPRNILGRYYLATALSKKGREREAIQQFQQVIDIAPASREGVEAFVEIRRLEQRLRADEARRKREHEEAQRRKDRLFTSKITCKWEREYSCSKICGFSRLASFPSWTFDFSANIKYVEGDTRPWGRILRNEIVDGVRRVIHFSGDNGAERNREVLTLREDGTAENNGPERYGYTYRRYGTCDPG